MVDFYKCNLEPEPPTWEVSTLEMSYPDSLLLAIRNFYIWASKCHDMAPPSACGTWVPWTHMNCTRMWSVQPCLLTLGTCTSTHSLSHRTDHVGVTTIKKLDQSHLYPSLDQEVPGLTCLPGIEPGPPTWEASTLEKSHPDSLLMAIQNFFIWAWECRNNTIISSFQC